MAIIYALLGLAVSTLLVFSVRGLSPEELVGDNDTKQKDDMLTVLESAKMLLSNKHYFLILTVFLLIQIFMAMPNIDTYFTKYVPGDENLLGTFTWVISIPLIIGLLVTPIIAKKLGEMCRVNLSGYVIATLGRLRVLVAAYFHNILLILILSTMTSLRMSPLREMLNAMIAEASEHTWLRTSKRIDELMFSCTSLGVEVGGGIGTAMAGWLLVASGYNGELNMQPDSAIQTFYVIYVWFPLVANTLAFLLLTRSDVEKANVRLRE